MMHVKNCGFSSAALPEVSCSFDEPQHDTVTTTATTTSSNSLSASPSRKPRRPIYVSATRQVGLQHKVSPIDGIGPSVC